MKSRRGNKAEDTGEIICAGFSAEAPGNLLLDPCTANRPWLEASLQFQRYCCVGNTPVPGKSQDVIFEVTEALQQTPEFALGPAPAFPGNALRNGVGGKPFVDQSVIAFKV